MLYICLDGSFFLVFDFAFTKLKTRPIAFLPFWAFYTTPYMMEMIFFESGIISQKPTLETVGYMMGMMFFESGIISQKPTLETVGYMMEMMFFKSWITDFHPGQRGWTAFRHCPNISVGATETRASRLYGTSTEMKFPAGVAFLPIST
jgi:hypothetical protein